MSNVYYERVNAFTRHTPARGDAVRAEFDAVEIGFDRLKDSGLVTDEQNRVNILAIGLLEATAADHETRLTNNTAGITDHATQLTAASGLLTDHESRLDDTETATAGNATDIATLEGNVVSYTATDFTGQAIAGDATVRANTVQGFDDAGNAALFERTEVPGAFWLNIASHGLPALPAWGFWPVYSAGAKPVQAIADADNRMATAFAVARPDANTVEVMRSGFIRIAGGHGLDVGTTYFLSQNLLGAMQTTQPASGLIQPLCEAWDTEVVLLMPLRPNRVN